MMYKLDFDLELSNSGTQAYATNARGYGFDLVHSTDSSKIPSEGSVFDCLVLEDDTTPTDFISLSNPCKHFIISRRVKLTLEKYVLSKVAFYSAKLFWKGEYLVEDFFLVWMHGNELDRVDFFQTKFIRVKGWITRQEEELPTLGKQQLLREFNETIDEPDETIRVNGKYYFVPPISDLDMFRIGEFDDWIYVSDRLVTDLQRLEPTGVEILPTREF